MIHLRLRNGPYAIASRSHEAGSNTFHKLRSHALSVVNIATRLSVVNIATRCFYMKHYTDGHWFMIFRLIMVRKRYALSRNRTSERTLLLKMERLKET